MQKVVSASRNHVLKGKTGWFVPFDRPGLAKKGGNEHGNSAKAQSGSNVATKRTQAESMRGLALGHAEKETIRAYLKDDWKQSCPPGLAKKNNGCLPPGQRKKYSIGGTLPMGYSQIPARLAQRLGPPPAGAFYAMVDRDVVLASEATKKILDAVTLLSAME